jgi:phosphopantothenoylcysteine decarboxylase
MKVLLAVTGSISAYKACSITSVLDSKGHEVQCVMTDNAQKFITPMSLSALSHRPVLTNEDEWSCSDGKIPHIYYTQDWEPDVFVIVPATINMMSKIYNLLADDIVSCMALAVPPDLRKIIFPAANTMMFQKSAFSYELKHRGWIVGNTQRKKLACGTVGDGALEETKVIIETIENNES